MSRNLKEAGKTAVSYVTPRERRVSRNIGDIESNTDESGHASREACE